MTPRLIPLAVVLAATAAACSKSESPPPKPAQAAASRSFTPVIRAELDEGAKDRIARREAATRMLEKNILEPTPPRAPEPPAAAKVPEPPKAAPAPAPVPQVQQNVVAANAAPRVEPAKAVPAAAPAQAAPPPVATPPPVAAAPKVDLAAATPSVPAPSTTARLVTRVDPDFPREAVQAGVDQGMVKAKMTLDAAGGVTRVEIVEANPRRVFDRAVTRALTLWRYNAGVEGRMVEMEIAFRR